MTFVQKIRTYFDEIDTLKVTDRIPQPLLRLGIFLMAWKEMEKIPAHRISLDSEQHKSQAE